MGHAGTVFDDQHRLAVRGGPWTQRDHGVGADHDRAGVHRADAGHQLVDLLSGGAAHLVDQHDVGHAQVRLAGVIRELVTGAQRVDDNDQQIRPDEREVVVAPVPHDHIGLGLGGLEDRGVVDARVHDEPRGDRPLVLLALLDRRMRAVDVRHTGEPLHADRLEVVIRHRVPHQCDPESGVAQQVSDVPGGLALARSGPHGADRHDGAGCGEHRRVRAEQAKIRARPPAPPRPGASHVVGYVGVGEHDLVDAVSVDQLGELVLGMNRDPVRVARAGQRRRVDRPSIPGI